MNGIKSIGFLATCNNSETQGEIHPINNAAIFWNDKGEITWIGEEANLPAEYKNAQYFDANGKLVVPGLIDCHTHLGFAGWRSQEFEMRILGKSYLEIEQSGGGIVSTVKKTREASKDEIKSRAHSFLKEIRKLGVTTIECKSGYGLNTETELKILRVYKDLAKEQKLGIVSTFLGAHTIPSEFKNNRAAYIDLVINEMLPAIANEKLATFCDIFVETSAFSIEEAKIIYEKAKTYGLRAKIHADQFSDSRGAVLAASVDAISADHLEYTGPQGIGAMKEKDVVAVMLPLATLYTNQKPAHARSFIDAGVKVAVATDFNPGSAPSFNLHFAMFLACTLNRMTPSEVLKSVTLYAAKAIGVENEVGSLEVGKYADVAVIDAEDPNEWMYHLRENRCLATFKNGLQL